MKPLTLLAVGLFSVTMVGQQSGTGKAQISIPNVKDVLELDVGPTKRDAHARPDGKETQLRALDRVDRLFITGFLQKVKFGASPEKCRAEWWPMTTKSAKVQREELRQSESDGMAVVEYIVPEFRGIAVRQKTVHAYLGSRDLCAEVHLSIEQFVPDDQKLFNDVLATARLLPDESVQEDHGHDQNNQYLAEGSQFYLQHKYSAAAERYQKALDLEKQSPLSTIPVFGCWWTIWACHTV